VKRPSRRIEEYSFGRITVDGKTFTNDLIISLDNIITDWWRKEGHSLYPEDLGCVLDIAPEVLVIGCGANNALNVPQETRQWIANRGIRLIDLPTGQACDRYNELAGKYKVIAGLHLTC
jgi:hypothetical protein